MINPTPAYLIPTQFTHVIYMIHILQRDLWILLFILRKENPIYYVWLVCLQWEYDLQSFKAITKADICHNQEIKSLFIKNVTHEWRDLSLILCEQGLWPRVPTLSVKINQKGYNCELLKASQEQTEGGLCTNLSFFPLTLQIYKR